MRIATFDIETDGLLDTVTRVWCAVVQEHDGQVHNFTPDNIDKLCSWLEQFDVLIGHNCIGFDFPVLRKIYGWEYKGTKVDTLLMSRLQRPNRVSPPHCPNKSAPNSVEAWGYRLGRIKIEHEEWDRYSEHMLERCKEDVSIQTRIYEALLEEGKGEGWTRAHKLNHKLFHYLQMQEEYGWLVDSKHLDRSIDILNTWISRIDRAVTPHLPVILEVEEGKQGGEYTYIKKPFKKDGTHTQAVLNWKEGNGIEADVVGPFSRISTRNVDLDKNKEVKEFLLSLGWEPDEWNINDDGIRTSPKFSKDDTYRGIRSSLGKLISKRIQCRQRKGILEGWKNSIRVDGRISASVGGMATTGRIRHKGIVNVPSPATKSFFAVWMRKVFIAKPGWVLVGTDSKGNQVRQLAARMGDEDFTHAALYGSSKDGTDIHSVNQRKSGVATRTLAKNVFYGFTFGAGDSKMGKLINGSSADGKALKESFLNGLPKLKDLIERLTNEWRLTAKKMYNQYSKRAEYANGYITGLDGRPILVEAEHTILVYYLQSDEAIQMAAAYCWLHKQLEKAGYVWKKDFGFVIWYHDEWQIECRKEIAEHVVELSNRAIQWSGEFFNIACPHEGESKIGNNWYETH